MHWLCHLVEIMAYFSPFAPNLITCVVLTIYSHALPHASCLMSHTSCCRYPVTAAGLPDRLGRLTLADQGQRTLQELGAWLRQHEEEQKDGSVGSQPPVQSPGGSVLL